MTNLEKAVKEIKETYTEYFIRCKEIGSVKLPKGTLDGHGLEYVEATKILCEKIENIEKSILLKFLIKIFHNKKSIR
ncbi:hypothetical protein [Fusobacterium periodonticum]|uniref:Uncharacterized protein n=1 Tax=Fusobacterium periodonticum D10 TaxID=620833 RepID=K1HD51_9FUSO|nr:hypothetical protein [Fusobacterium periodonticum]EKA93393.1 hypothetical protein FPOG_00298 [Fusobacterium periodonticum D10]